MSFEHADTTSSVAPDSWLDGDLLGFDLETTGTDPFSDRPVSFAMVTYRHGERIRSTHRLVNPGIPIPEAATAIHHITDDMVQKGGMPLDEAIAFCCDALCSASAAGVPVVGMVLRFDLSMIGHLDLARSCCGLRAPAWNGPALDVSVIDRRLDKWRKGRRTLLDLCTEYEVELGEDAHDASADAIAAIEVLLAQARRYGILAKTDLPTLTERQASLYRENLLDLSDFRLRRGDPPIPPHEIDGGWPVAAPPNAYAGTTTRS